MVRNAAKMRYFDQEEGFGNNLVLPQFGRVNPQTVQLSKYKPQDSDSTWRSQAMATHT